MTKKPVLAQSIPYVEWLIWNVSTPTQDHHLNLFYTWLMYAQMIEQLIKCKIVNRKVRRTAKSTEIDWELEHSWVKMAEKLQ